MTDRLAARYRRFAETEAHGHSPLYEALAFGIAGDADVLAFVSTLPADKQQPNLLLAAVRHIAGTPADWPAFRAALLSQPDAVRATMLARSTQTNEPARCAVLLPALARLRGPLALLEVRAATVRSVGATWISNEVPSVFPDIAAKAAVPRPRGAFLLAIDGEPVAWTDPHGAWVEWFGS